MNPRHILVSGLILACLIAPALGVLPHPAAAQSRNPENYVLLVETSAAITRGSTVNGNVGINETGGSLSLTRNATIAGNSQAVADRVKLGPLSRVFDVFTNVLKQNSNGSVIAGTLTFPVPQPVYVSEPLIFPDPFEPTNFPPAFPITCGGPDKLGATNESFTLPPGTYDRVSVARGGKATLLSGTYQFCSLRTVRGNIDVTGPVTLNIRDDFRLGASSILTPVGLVSAGDIQLNVGGVAVRLGGTDFQGRIFAPNALLRLGRGMQVTGHFVAARMRGDKGFLVNPATCGDGVLDPGETCEPPGTPEPPNNNPCRMSCTFCGDGVVQSGEQCDDGNDVDTDGCRDDCTPPPPPACGNSTLDSGETCDPPGSDPPPAGGNLCRVGCTYCGDGVVDGGEQCDDGNDIDTDGCSNDCVLPPPPTCGDGLVNAAGETCDPPGSDPEPPGGNLCRTNCTYCGDGTVQTGEECDDANTNDTDGCRNDCTILVPPPCGNTMLDPGETCDPPGSDPPPPGGNLCRVNCTYCGDGLAQVGEECDDGNSDDNDSCHNDCTLGPPPPGCGNFILDAGETCDPPGSDPPPPGGDLCRSDCTYCGDGLQNGTEQCDDGNTNDNDSCRNDCTLPPPPPTCGDGLVNQASESCDPPGSDPPPMGGNLCRLDCTYCGDGMTNSGEQCDDGNTIDSDGCRNDCTLPPPPDCGDGSINAAGETCDPPGAPQPPSGNACGPNCTYCGDGIVDSGEQCDDGNANNADACRNDCTPQPPTCGDGVINQAGETCEPPGSDPPPPGGNLCRLDCTYCGDGVIDGTEECDDGNSVDTDLCANDCTIPPPRCGDGLINAPGETCEPPGASQPPNANPCRGDCTFCGDGVVDGTEQCDDGNANNDDNCRNDCTTPPPPPGCGNSIVTPPETCDPPGSPRPPNGNVCRADCTFCGDGVVNGGEVCDDGNSNNTDTCSNTCACTGTLTVVGCGYPYSSNNPRTSVVFNESEVLRAFSPSVTAGSTIKMWYNDEHALTLGVRQVVVKTGSGTTTTNYPVSPMCGTPAAGCGVVNPLVGTTAVDGDQAGTDTASCAGSPDLCDRPMWPSLFITEITSNPSSTAGDWQQGGTPIVPSAVFGTWKGAIRSVNKTKSPVEITVTPDADPAKNNYNLDGGDPAPAGLVNQGYGAETRWNVNDLGLVPGHAYRLQVMVHDGDQNKTGGDVGEACATVCVP